MWLAALYFTGFGYASTYRQRYVNLNALMEDAANVAGFEKICRDIMFRGQKDYQVAGTTFTFRPDWQIKHCRQLVGERYAFSEKAVSELALISLPTGMGKLHISDFGIMGNAAVLLILIWLYYSMRRENHAIKSFVDFDERYRRVGLALPSSFTLSPQDANLSAEHYAYSYHAVAQRFVFLFSTHSRPLFYTTIGLGSVPAITSTLNFVSDGYSLASLGAIFEPAVYVRFAIEVALFILVWVVTLSILSIMVETSVLLNGWSLAVRDVWMREWDESNDDFATDVRISVSDQSAERIQSTDATK